MAGVGACKASRRLALITCLFEAVSTLNLEAWACSTSHSAVQSSIHILNSFCLCRWHSLWELHCKKDSSRAWRTRYSGTILFKGSTLAHHPSWIAYAARIEFLVINTVCPCSNSNSFDRAINVINNRSRTIGVHAPTPIQYLQIICCPFLTQGHTKHAWKAWCKFRRGREETGETAYVYRTCFHSQSHVLYRVWCTW